MPTVFECHGHLHGDPGAAWAVLADFGAIASWVAQIDHSNLLSEQATGVGAVRRAQLGRTVLTEHVTEWTDGQVLAYEIRGLPPVLASATARWSLDRHADHTDVTVTVTVEAANPAGRAAMPLLRRRLSRSYLDMIDDLAAATTPAAESTP